MPIKPGAEPFYAEGGRTGVLLCHGFSGSPASLRPWGQHLADSGHTVALPRLPGHGTTVEECNKTKWADWYATDERELLILFDKCERVFVGGLSMGGALAVHLAQQHPEVAGIMLVNPALASRDPKRHLVPVLSRLGIGEYPGIADDIAKEGQDEVAYDKTPVHALLSFMRQWPMIVGDLHKVKMPTIVFHSANDNLLDGSSVKVLKEQIGSNDFSYVHLPLSQHVATLDHDAEMIFERSVAFIERISAVEESAPSEESTPAEAG